MIPIHELLSRIRWDPEFAKGNFELGYYDRAEDRLCFKVDGNSRPDFERLKFFQVRLTATRPGYVSQPQEHESS